MFRLRNFGSYVNYFLLLSQAYYTGPYYWTARQYDAFIKVQQRGGGITDFSMFFSDKQACVLIYVQLRVPIYQLQLSHNTHTLQCTLHTVYAALLVGLRRVHYRVCVLYCSNNKFWYCGSTKLSSFTRYNSWVHEGYMPGFNVYMNPLPSQDAALLIYRLLQT